MQKSKCVDWSKPEVALAKKLYDERIANNPIRKEHVVAEVQILSTGSERLAYRRVIWKDFLPEARTMLQT